VVLDLVTWLAEARSTGINWHTHHWTSMPIIICGFDVTWTEPGRPRSVLDSTVAAKARTRPRQALAGVLAGALSWTLLPLIAMVPGPVGLYVVFVWPVLLLVEIAVAICWWWRHGRQIEELTDGQRTVYLPASATHPVFLGWITGMLALILVWGVVDQLRIGF